MIKKSFFLIFSSFEFQAALISNLMIGVETNAAAASGEGVVASVVDLQNQVCLQPSRKPGLSLRKREFFFAN